MHLALTSDSHNPAFAPETVHGRISEEVGDVLRRSEQRYVALAARADSDGPRRSQRAGRADCLTRTGPSRVSFVRP